MYYEIPSGSALIEIILEDWPAFRDAASYAVRNVPTLLAWLGDS